MAKKKRRMGRLDRLEGIDRAMVEMMAQVANTETSTGKGSLALRTRVSGPIDNKPKAQQEKGGLISTKIVGY